MFNRHAILWGIISLGIIGILFMVVAVVRQEKENAPSNNIVLPSAVSSDDWIKGPDSAKTILVEYSDFQCPACRFYYPFVKQLENDFPDKLRVVYRHFPLPIHNFSYLAAQAAEAAGQQKKFWEMHDLLFEQQEEWAASKNNDAAFNNFISYARTLNLDINKFKNDFGSREIKSKIDGDFQGGEKAGIQGTPSFFLSGRFIANPSGYDEFKKLIGDEINK